MYDKLMANLAPQTKAVVDPFVGRWTAYLQKASQRQMDVLAEADAGISEIIAANPLDQVPISGALTTVESRFKSISSKIDRACEKLHDEMEPAIEELDLDDELQDQAIHQISGIMRFQAEDLSHDVEKQSYLMLVKKGSEWARAIYPHAEAESAQPRECPNCGGQLQLGALYAATNITCPFCNSVNTIQPGLAAGLYYMGLGVHYLAEDAAKELWVEMFDAEYEHNDRRVPTATDRQRYLDTVSRYWTAYFSTVVQHNPGHPRTVEESVADRMGHYNQPRPVDEQAAEQLYEQVYNLGVARDEAGLRNFFQQNKDADGFDFDDAVRVMLEHKDNDGAMLILRLYHQFEEEDDPIDQWMQQQMVYLTY